MPCIFYTAGCRRQQCRGAAATAVFAKVDNPSHTLFHTSPAHLRVVIFCVFRIVHCTFQRSRCVLRVAGCALRVARCELRVARCEFRVVLFFCFAKRKKSSATKEEAAQKEMEAAAEGEERKINLGREDEATAHRKYPVT